MPAVLKPKRIAFLTLSLFIYAICFLNAQCKYYLKINGSTGGVPGLRFIINMWFWW